MSRKRFGANFICLSLISIAAVTVCAPLTTAAAEEAKPITIALAGDSTVTDRSGWGVGFAEMLTTDAKCLNFAQGGRSSKSFRDEGHWQKVIDSQPSIALIQFGHNDQPGKGPLRETDPGTTFRENLKRYVAEVRTIGAKPIIVTSLSRRRWAEDGVHIASILTEYVQAARAVAAELNVPLIDLHQRSIVIYEAIGPSGCERISPRGKDGTTDHTHLNSLGSKMFGLVVADELRKVMPAAEHCVRHRDVPASPQEWRQWLDD